MKKECPVLTLEREAALAIAMEEVATELRLVDLLDLAAFVRLDQFANIEHIINASTEIHFRPDVLRFSQVAEVDLDWNGDPKLSFGMIFDYGGVKIYFRLLIMRENAAVEIDFIDISNPSDSVAENTQRIRHLMNSARREFTAVSDSWL